MHYVLYVVQPFTLRPRAGHPCLCQCRAPPGTPTEQASPLHWTHPPADLHTDTPCSGPLTPGGGSGRWREERSERREKNGEREMEGCIQ